MAGTSCRAERRGERFNICARRVKDQKVSNGGSDKGLPVTHITSVHNTAVGSSLSDLLSRPLLHKMFVLQKKKRGGQEWEKCVCMVRGKFHHCLQGQSHSKTEQPPRSWGGPDWNHLRSDAWAQLPTVLVNYSASKQT